MASKEDKIKQFLRNIGNDVNPDGSKAYVECSVFEELDEDGYGHCPDHEDCGICRFEYMKRKGWLNIA